MNEMPSYRLKVERAKRHINELGQEIAAFFARSPFVIHVQEDLKAGERVWWLEIREIVPREWSAIVGDAIHNLRASLDLMMVAIVRRCDPARQSYGHVYFVVSETKSKFELRLAEAIKGASPEARRLIEDLRP
ncbi:MAG: hypothetical protein JO303_15100, partial [Caulobacteraceae bacterium]|nr:hypothetical protein [Caulobacteraceae bacterium]